MKKQLDMAHVLGWFFLGFILVAAIGISAVLSTIFFVGITPPGMAWFVYLALSLTEIGMVLWLGAFFLMRHHAFHKTVAIVMACLHGLSSFVVAGYELNRLLFRATDVSAGGASITTVAIMLQVIFAADLLAVFVDVISRYFEMPGHNFRNPPDGFIPEYSQNGNFNSRSIAENSRSNGNKNSHPQITVKEIQSVVAQTVTGLLEGNPDFLANRALPSPRKREEVIEGQAVTLAHIGKVIAGGVSSLKKKLNGNTNNGETAALAPGDRNETMLESGLPEENEEEQEQERTDLDVWQEAYERSPLKSSMTFPEFVRRMKGIEEESAVEVE